MTASSSFANHALQLLQKVQRGVSHVELVYTSHERWPLPPGQTNHTRPTLRISVFDSSFNPPTLAHLALASSVPPPLSHPATSSREPYDARMLLLSVRNADKTLKPGDATFVQRLEMMRLLSHDVYSNDTRAAGMLDSQSPQMRGNVAVAIVDEPTFVGKSTLLLSFLRARLATVVGSANSSNIAFDKRDASCPFQVPSPKLTFLLGFDTLIRLCSPKYYPSEQAMVQMLQKFFSSDEEDCRVVCARRQSVGISDLKTLEETQTRTFEVAHEFMRADRLTFIDIGPEEQTFSSTEIRTKVEAGDRSWRRSVTDAIAQCIIQQGIYLKRE